MDVFTQALILNGYLRLALAILETYIKAKRISVHLTPYLNLQFLYQSPTFGKRCIPRLL